ncbi:macrolide ABC transporter ATP-binding protein [Kineobactrum sediminis]|uniref:Macrolide ABC transporter ATP-binding protein n=1 Tax=Kineobactrum sediminis TaxID=1905677 RepID=A0A2N5Y1E0_9GAMM|nr:ABC transporter ATP-binding protein [Kineobactrum sediminis]PLW82179.1 macrolide ABC transporter ATP-binding protein [Kineobactrum sediminis]
MAAVICEDLTKIFRQGDAVIKALDHLGVTIEDGEFISLSGPSGSGKTTLLNAIGGLDQPDSGHITIGGQRIDQLPKARLADMRLHNIGFVFQSYNLIPVLSARENVEFVMQVQGITPKERREKSAAILREVGLEGMEDRRPGELSGGQQQRVAVARAIVSEPALVLADEPTANLDSETMAQLMDLFVKLNEHHRVTFVIATHDQRVMNYTKRRIHLKDGRIVSDEV